MAAIAEVYELADGLGITGTPSYIVGNEVVFGAVGYDRMMPKIANLQRVRQSNLLRRLRAVKRFASLTIRHFGQCRHVFYLAKSGKLGEFSARTMLGKRHFAAIRLCLYITPDCITA